MIPKLVEGQGLVKEHEDLLPFVPGVLDGQVERPLSRFGVNDARAHRVGNIYGDDGVFLLFSARSALVATVPMLMIRSTEGSFISRLASARYTEGSASQPGLTRRDSGNCTCFKTSRRARAAVTSSRSRVNSQYGPASKYAMFLGFPGSKGMRPGGVNRHGTFTGDRNRILCRARGCESRTQEKKKENRLELQTAIEQMRLLMFAWAGLLIDEAFPIGSAKYTKTSSQKSRVKSGPIWQTRSSPFQPSPKPGKRERQLSDGRMDPVHDIGPGTANTDNATL
jgi:hypothetical protein